MSPPSRISTDTALSTDSSTTPPLPRPIIKASYVTSTSGTGLVHTAPAHGVEDYEAWRDYNSQRAEDSSLSVLPKVPCVVDSLGQYSSLVTSILPDQPELAESLVGKSVLKEGNAEVIKFLQAGVDARKERYEGEEMVGGSSGLLVEVVEHHRVAVDWRTKKPVIFRCVDIVFSVPLERITDGRVVAEQRISGSPISIRSRLTLSLRWRKSTFTLLPVRPRLPLRRPIRVCWRALLIVPTCR